MNTKFNYTIDSKPLSKSVCERDLGIYIQYDLKLNSQIKNVTVRANRLFGMIRRSFKFSTKK